MGAAKRIAKLEADGAPARLRLQIDGGGCSGFEYKFEVERADAPVDEDDHVFTRENSSVVVDDSSLEFVRGATIDFQQEMIRSAFAVTDNEQRVRLWVWFVLRVEELRVEPGYRLI